MERSAVHARQWPFTDTQQVRKDRTFKTYLLQQGCSKSLKVIASPLQPNPWVFHTSLKDWTMLLKAASSVTKFCVWYELLSCATFFLGITGMCVWIESAAETAKGSLDHNDRHCFQAQMLTRRAAAAQIERDLP